MLSHRSTALGALSLALTSAVIVACGGSTSPSLSADTRCGGIAHVPAWNMAMAVHLADSRALDTLSIRLHQDLQPSALSHAVADPVVNDTATAFRQWTTAVPGGAFAEHDTVINSTTFDTVSAASFGYLTGSEIYMAVDLKTCTATVGGVFVARDSVIVAGPDRSVSVDTVNLGYAIFTDIPVDSTTAVDGLVNLGTKVYTYVSPSADFLHLPQYQVGGLSGVYTLSGGSQVLDSATVGYLITAASTPAPGAPTPLGSGSAPARGRVGSIFVAPRVTGGLP